MYLSILICFNLYLKFISITLFFSLNMSIIYLLILLLPALVGISTKTVTKSSANITSFLFVNLDGSIQYSIK